MKAIYTKQDPKPIYIKYVFCTFIAFILETEDSPKTHICMNTGLKGISNARESNNALATKVPIDLNKPRISLNIKILI